MITLKNPAVTDNWIIDLKTYSQVEGRLPLNGLNVRNDSNIVAWVDLDGLKVGEVQRYSADSFQGRNFDRIRIYNPNGQEFAADDLFIQATKGEVMSSQPFNPQWDMMFNDMDRFATGTNNRVSLTDDISMDLIKYWVNLQNSLIVQRRLDVQAHATLLGVYKIIFGDSDILSGAVGIGTPPPADTLLYRKTIVNEAFDYSETNASIVGYTVDLKIRDDDISSLYTLDVDLYGNGENAYDDDLSSKYGLFSNLGTSTETTFFEVSFPSKDINHLYYAIDIASVNAAYGWVKFYIYKSGGWVELSLLNSIGLKTLYDTTAHAGVTGIKMTWYGSAGGGDGTITGYVRDLSAFT